MAVIHNKFSGIDDKIKSNEKSLLRTYGLSWAKIGFCILIAAITGYLDWPIISIIALLGAIFSIYSFSMSVKSHSEKEAIDTVGAEGENLTLSYLQVLDNSFHIIPNAVYSYGEKKSEMDAVVVGPTGIYIIEVKNYKGNIYGNTSDHDLVQVKTDNYGNTFEKPFYNPVKQVATHRYTLSGVLEEYGENTYINTCVFFTNPYSSVNIINDNDCDCKILTDGKSLVDYIRSGEEILKPWDIEAVLRLLGIEFLWCE